MVWPQAIGRAESSQARSVNSSGVNSSRGVRSIPSSTLLSVTPCDLSARISRALRVSVGSCSRLAMTYWAGSMWDWPRM